MKIFTIATAHLDTSWLWTQEETIRYLIRPTFEDNFRLIDKYPNYRFNFEGSYRYELLKEYYPETYEKLKEYVSANRFNVTGSAFENGDVNIVSPESLIRNILIGNTYFYNEFGKRSNDIFLPDCFGFGKVLPSVMSHCGLKGFSTQKLTWGSQNGIPFEIGKWNGLDNKPVFISIDGEPYETIIDKNVRSKYRGKLEKNNKIGIDMTMLYHGTGDRGGTPHKRSVDSLEKAMAVNDISDIEVLSSSPSELFEYLETIDKNITFPAFDDEFLLSTHGVGSYTSRTQTKRFNKRCEVLADICERANSISYMLGYPYPEQRLNFAWKKVLQHHFHDDITGTSFTESYKRSYNDYIQALNIFESEYKNAIRIITDNLDTSDMEGIPVAVFNPSQDDTTYMTCVKIAALNNKKVRILNSEGKEVTSQVNGDSVYFKDCFKGNTVSLYEVRVLEENAAQVDLKNPRKLENDKYIIGFDDNYSISSIYDKELGKELLASPIEYELISDTNSIEWPSWEIQYKDIIKRPYGCPRFESFRVLDNGEIFTRVEIIKKYNNSVFRQEITLEKSGKRIDVFNSVDWSLEATNLKIRFKLNASNPNASYDLGFGSVLRGNNTEKKYEVPAQRFVDITDENKDFGVSILSDSRTGYDKPDDSTIRLTAIHTPLSNFRYETSQHLQDIGINRFSYAITSHKSGLESTVMEAESFVKGVQAFVIKKHKAAVKEISLMASSHSNVRVSAVKKAYEGNELIIRVNEYCGKACDNVVIKLPCNVLKAYECYGDERIINEIDNSLTFNMNPYEIKTFRITLDIDKKKKDEEFVDIEFDCCGITTNETRKDSGLKNQISLPKEIIDDIVSSCSVDFRICKDKAKNALSLKGQILNTGSGYKYANILMLNSGKDKELFINGNTYAVQSSMENLGCWDLVAINEAAYVKKIGQDYTLTHYHTPAGDAHAHNVYLYNVKVPIVDGKIVLPVDGDIYIYAITLNNIEDMIPSDKLFDFIEKRTLSYQISPYARRKSQKPVYQKFIDLFANRRGLHKLIRSGGYTTQSLSDAYMLIDLFLNKKYSAGLEKKMR